MKSKLASFSIAILLIALFFLVTSWALSDDTPESFQIDEPRSLGTQFDNASKEFKMKEILSSKTFIEKPFAETIAPQIFYALLISLGLVSAIVIFISCWASQDDFPNFEGKSKTRVRSWRKLRNFDNVTFTGGDDKTIIGGLFLIFYVIFVAFITFLNLKYAFQKNTLMKMATNFASLNAPRHFPMNIEAEVLLDINTMYNNGNEDIEYKKSLWNTLVTSHSVSDNLKSAKLSCDLSQTNISTDEYKIKVKLSNLHRTQELHNEHISIKFSSKELENDNLPLVSTQWKFRIPNEYDVEDKYKHISELEYLWCGFGTPEFTTPSWNGDGWVNSSRGVLFSGNTKIHLMLYPYFYQNSITQIFYYAYIPQISKIESFGNDGNQTEISFVFSNDDTDIRYDTIYVLVTLGQALEYSMFAAILGWFIVRTSKKFLSSDID
jgi:hypothetical protein